MSEYQYYEFAAIDRPLTKKQQQEVRALSTRAEISATRFFNEYEWGDFKGDPHQLVEKHYDAFMYYANWGTTWCMFRIPRELGDVPTWKRFEVEGAIKIHAKKQFVVVEIRLDDEDGSRDAPYDSQLSAILPVRDALLAGDATPLYVAWLACVAAGYLDDDTVEPCDPKSLSRSFPGMTALAEFLIVPPALLKAALKPASAPQPKGNDGRQLAAWIAALEPAIKDALLLELLGDQCANARAKALHDFRASTRKKNAAALPPGTRMAGQLLDATGIATPQECESD